MTLTVVLLLVSSALAVRPATGFSGGSMTFTPGNRYLDGLVEVHFYHRESSRGPCFSHPSWTCENVPCGEIIFVGPEVTDQSSSTQSVWCQSEVHMTTNVSSNAPLILSNSGCCWEDNVNNTENWRLQAHVDTGRRSDTQSPNRSPVSAAIANIRIPQNCFQSLHLLAHDPDGDVVRCKTVTSNEHPSIHLDEDSCTLHRTGLLDVGLHVFELMLEDYPVSEISVTNSDGVSTVKNAFNLTVNSNITALSQVPLQFGVEILGPVQSCVPGEDKPSFLTPTPLHGEVHHAAVGHAHEILIRARTPGISILDFQVSGPFNISKTLRVESPGFAVATLTWTPQESDLYRHVPVCFAAETLHSQSEMRCIVVVVAKSRILAGEAEVICGSDSISIVVNKSSMEGIDQNWLQLRDPTCSLTSNDTHILGTMSLNTCGTTVEDSGDFMVFKNEINSFETPNAVITRRNQVKIGFSCQYPKLASVSSYYVNHKSDYIFTESSFGTFGYSFEVYTDNSFSSRVDPTLYPVEVKLMEKLYMGVEAQSTLPEVRLFIESCKATPEDNPYSAVYYDIIKDGCILDDTVKVYPSDSMKYDFEIKAFKFTGSFDQVYISCSVILCAEGSPNSRCAQGCLSHTTQKHKRDLKQETARHYIMQGPLRVSRETHNSLDASNNGGSGHISTSTGVFAGLFIITIIVLVGLLVHNAKKSRALDRRHLLSSF